MPAPGGTPELELIVPPGTKAGDLWAALHAHVALVVDSSGTADRTFLDTFDGRLRAVGALLERSGGPRARRVVLTLHERGRPPLAAAVVVDGALALCCRAISDASLRTRVERVVGVRALLPVAHVRSQLAGARVLNRDDKTVVRLLLERPVVVRRGQPEVELATRLRLLPVRGYDRAFARLASTLTELGLASAGTAMVDEAVAAAGGSPGGVRTDIAIELSSSQRADTATVAVCRRLAGAVEENLPGLLDDLDTEFVHDVRVAVRRTRSVLKEISGVLPTDAVDRSRATMRWLHVITGPTRDLDVHLLEWPALTRDLPGELANDLAPARVVISRDREQALRKMRRAFRSARFTEEWRAWTSLLARDLAIEPDADRPNAARPIGAVAGKRILRVHDRMVTQGGAIDDASPAVALHDVRKLGKELRYLLELFGSCWPSEDVAALVASLRGLQDVLGRFYDAQVQAIYLRRVAEQLSRQPGTAGTLVGLGALIERLAKEEAAARRGFAARFSSFAATRNRRLVRRTFG